MSSLLSLPEISCPDSCHICEDGKPRWYCAADEAYLCDDCDISVHGMNSLALMHERLVLDCSSGYNELAQKVPCSAPGTKDDVNIKHASSSMYDSYNSIKGSVQKLKKDFLSDERQAMTCTDQTSGFVNFGDITYTRSTNVKQLKSKSESPDEHELPYEFNVGHSEWKALENRLSVHEVPVLIPVAQEMHSISFDQEEADPKQACSSFLGASLVDDSSTCNFMEYLVPEFCDADSSIISSIDHVSYSEEEASAVNAKQASTDVYGYVRERICHELQGNKSATIEFSFPNKSPQNILQEYDRYYDRNTNDLLLEYLELNVLKRSEKPKAIATEMFVPLAWVCEKMKVESNGETDHINQHLEALIKRPFHIITTEVGNQQSFLSLNYEDILSAWSDRGCFWTDGQNHMAVSLHDSSSSSLEEANLDVGIVPELEPETTKPPYQQKETASLCASTEDGGREARVLRYREKRRTRLFSKKIRYEVRKLNAEKRPRVKGRFVKRS